MSLVNNIQRNAVEKKTSVYGKFRGVDFSVDPSLVDDSRSPYAPNLISDTGGMPEKRLGWRTLHTIEQPVNGLFHAEFDNEEYFIAHGGTKLYKWNDEEFEVLYEGVANHRSTAFYAQKEDGSRLYILTGGEYLVFDGKEVKDVCENAYVPKVLSGISPKGGDGATIMPVNLLTDKRQEGFIGTGTDTVYQLSNTEISSVDKVESIKEDGTTETLKVTTDYSVDLTKGTVTFKSAKPAVVTGQDNILITYSKASEGSPKEYITKCTCAISYGSNNAQVFLSGNDEYKNRVWYSYYNNPEYMPDTWWISAGTEENAVMGFLRVGRYLEIVKEDNQQDSTVYQTYVSVDANGNAEVPVEQGSVGVGAIGRYTFANLLDEPLFLSRRGIFTIYSNNVLAERTLKNRSYFLDAQLTKEDNLENAVATEWNGYYLLAVNSRCYVLDSRNKAYRHNRSDSADDFVYESYHWENFPAVCFLSIGGSLYFGTADGRICKMNTDIKTMTRFNDDGEAVVAIWSTKNDDDGASYLYKTMQKKGCSVTIKPYTRSSCSIYFSKDGNPDVFIRKNYMDIFNWEDLDFERFSFNTNDSPQDVYLKKKVKKYKRLQLIIKNDGLNEGFGILQIAKTYTVGNYAKK